MRSLFLTLLVTMVMSTALAQTPDRKPVVLTDAAMQLHREALLIDGHNDLAWQFRKKTDLSFQNLDISKPQPALHTDIPRLRKGGVGAQFWAAYIEADKYPGPAAVKATLEQIDVIHRLVRAYPDTFAMAYSVDDILRIRKDGKIASLIGIEGGHSIDSSLAVLRTYHTLGTRYMTLTHTESLDWADSATDAPKCNGLSPFGEQVVQEMNRIGMIVDISHVSPATMKHVLKVSRAPIIASHSSAYALAQHPRNVPDDVLELMPKNGGVIMVNFFSGFITPEGARITQTLMQDYRKLRAKYTDERELQAAVELLKKERSIPAGTIHHVVDHIDHIVKVAGIDHVGIGSDFDGITKVPQQLEDVSCYPLITQELLNRGYTKEAIHKVLGGNVLRVFRKVEEAAR